MNARITFANNPWPEGHAQSSPSGVEHEDGLSTLGIDLSTADYAADRDAPESEVESDWESPIVWNNYHSARFRGAVALPPRSPRPGGPGRPAPSKPTTTS